MSNKPVYVLASVLVAVFAGVVGYGQYVKYNDPCKFSSVKWTRKPRSWRKSTTIVRRVTLMLAQKPTGFSLNI